MSAYRWLFAFGLFAISTLKVTGVWAYTAPDYYEEPGYNSTRAISGDQAANEVIDPFGGGLQLQYTDMVIPGKGGLDIEILRTYRSLQGQAGLVGPGYLPGRTSTGVGWDIHFGRVWSDGVSSSIPNCKFGGDISGNPVLELPDGTRQVLVSSLSTSTGLITKDRWMARCRTDGLDVYSPDGRHYVFNKFHSIGGNSVYSVTYIEDANENHLNFNYSTSKNNSGEYLLESITSSDVRTVTFTYDDKFGSETLLRNITANNQTIEYNYQQVVSGSNISGYYYLTSVTHPDLSKYSYSYHNSEDLPVNDLDGLYSLKTVTGPHTSYPSPSGMTTTYTYDSVLFDPGYSQYTTHIATKTISGGGVTNGTWSYQFLPANSGSTTNTTIVTTPLGRIEYDHRSSRNPASGSIWRIGTLEEKRLYTGSILTQTEEYSWTPQTISTQSRVERRYQVSTDAYFYAPLLVQKIITRDGTSYQTTYSGHDAYGNPATMSETGNGQSRTTNYTYYINTGKWIVNRQDKVTVVGIGSIDKTFDANGNVESEDRYGVVTDYSYHSTGDLRKRTDARGIVTHFASYKRGIPRTETRAKDTVDQVIVERLVNNTGTIASESIDGRTTSFTYDKRNRVKSITKPDASSNVTNIAWSYSGSGITRVLTRGPFSETRSYDSLGKLKSSDAEGIVTTFDYDAEGNKIFRSDPGSSAGDTMTYDILGRLKRTTHRDNTWTENTYLSANRVQIRDERAKLTTYTYRSYGDPDERLLTKIEAPEGVTTDIGRDVQGKVTSVTQGGKTRTFVYDSRQYLDYIINPETGTTQLDFDDNENLISRQVGSSGVTTYVYDGLNRLKNTNYPGLTPDINYSYYPDGELETTQKGASLWTYQYDDNRNLTSETLTIGSDTYTIGRGYNGNDALQSITYPSGLSVAYNPDDLGRPTEVGSYILDVQYYPDGQTKSLEYANGVSTDISQNNRRRPENLDVVGGAGTIIDRFYGYDAAGNTTTINDYRNSLNNLTLGYDDIDRLESVNGVVAISYDATGNIQTKNTGLNNLSYNYNTTTGLLNSVTRGGAAWYNLQYDVYGNVTGNGFDTFVYDDASQLAQVSNESIDYEYDGNGNRFKTLDGTTKHTVYSQDGLLMYEDKVGSAEVSDYIYLGRQLVARRDQCGSIDTDSDGIPDCVETRAGLDASDSADAAQDDDGDGLSNLGEYQAGTSFSNPDTDGDGMTDGYEVSNGLNPVLDDAAGDIDVDGLTNLQEFQYGTDPNNADTDSDGVSDGDEVAAGTDPTLNIAAVLIPIFNLLLN